MSQEQDREEMAMGIKAGIAYMELQRMQAEMNDKVLSKEEMQKVLNDSLKMAIPSKYKDISAEDVRELLIQDIIQEVSLRIIKDKDIGFVIVGLEKKNDALNDKLVDYWKLKGYHIEPLEDNRVKISWL